MSPAPSASCLVVSPHCDDAVFGCGDFLARHPGCRVVTVFAGAPDRSDGVTPWDAAAGFGPGDDVMAARRTEDATALATVGATPAWLAFRDAQYGPSPAVGQIADALAAVVDAVEPETVVLPLGLFHSDHALVHEAGLAVLRQRGGTRVLAYAEPAYRRVPGLLDARLAGLAARGWHATPLPDDGPPSAEKRAAVAAYRSQLRALASPGKPGVDDILAGERFWVLRP